MSTYSEDLTPEEEEALRKLLSNPFFFPDVFKDWISEKVRGDVTSQLPFAEILKSDTLKGAINLFPGAPPEYVTHALFKPAGTTSIPGPCQAVIFFAGSSYNWDGDYGALGLSVNNAAVDGAQVCWYRGYQRRIFGGRAQFVNLPNDDNTVRMMVMKIGSGDVDFQDLATAVFRIFQSG